MIKRQRRSSQVENIEYVKNLDKIEDGDFENLREFKTFLFCVKTLLNGLSYVISGALSYLLFYILNIFYNMNFIIPVTIIIVILMKITFALIYQKFSNYIQKRDKILKGDYTE